MRHETEMRTSVPAANSQNDNDMESEQEGEVGGNLSLHSFETKKSQENGGKKDTRRGKRMDWSMVSDEIDKLWQ